MKITSRALADLAIEAALDKKGQQIMLMDIQGLSDMADFFIIVSGDSNLQVKAIADNIQDKLREEGQRIYHKEGMDNLNWVLLDYVDVVVHVFRKETREFYGLERVWADAKTELIMDEKHES